MITIQYENYIVYQAMIIQSTKIIADKLYSNYAPYSEKIDNFKKILSEVGNDNKQLRKMIEDYIQGSLKNNIYSYVPKINIILIVMGCYNGMISMLIYQVFFKKQHRFMKFMMGAWMIQGIFMIPCSLYFNYNLLQMAISNDFCQQIY